MTSTVTDLAEWATLVLANGQHDGREMISPSALLPALRAQAFGAPAGTDGSRSGSHAG
ncbi:hypothetical protein [Ancylobacter sp.]|uniref:hypothetical protein n=1 Tax=Ancylobacter sp. TaxID=1872567 RepID=UPI003D12BBB2